MKGIVVLLVSRHCARETVRQSSADYDVPEMVFVARLYVAGSSIRAGETNAGIDRYFTVLTLEGKRGQGKPRNE